MKVQLKALKPNPFRKIEKYPIDREKVQALKTSINETTFWDNILARKNGDFYELAYGHHRWIALKELNIKEIDIPVRELENGLMIQIMANENLDQWKARPSIINETVLTAKEYLDNELAKYETWEELQQRPDLINLLEQKTEKSFNKTKAGVGQTTILKFLGGNWKQWMIQEALDTIKAKDIDREAVEQFDTTEQARKFKAGVRKLKKDYKVEIPKKEQKKMAKSFVKEGLSKREIDKRFEEMAETKKKKNKQEPKPLPMLDDIVENIITLMGKLGTELNKVKGSLSEHNFKSSRILFTFYSEGRILTDNMNEMFSRKELKNG